METRRGDIGVSVRREATLVLTKGDETAGGVRDSLVVQSAVHPRVAARARKEETGGKGGRARGGRGDGTKIGVIGSISVSWKLTGGTRD